MVVEVKKALERVVDAFLAREVATAEGDSPVFMKDGSLKTLDEAVCPAVTRLGAGVPDVELRAQGVEEALELAAAVREDALELPASLSVGRQQDALEKARSGWLPPRE